MLVPTARRAGARGRPGSSAAVTGDGGATAEVELGETPEPGALRQARAIAARLAIRPPRHAATRRRGSGDLTSTRFHGDSDDIDLDATLEALAGHPVPADDDIVVREQRGSRRAVVLLVDVSGSMRGERVRTAAATVGALAGELTHDGRSRLAVIAFWSDAALLSPLRRPDPAGRLLDTLLRIPARGLTNVAFPLTLAARQLVGVPMREGRVLLLSDCVHNAGPDPRSSAARLPRLDVLVDTSGEHDLTLARELAELGRGRLATSSTHRDVAQSLNALFAAT